MRRNTFLRLTLHGSRRATVLAGWYAITALCIGLLPGDLFAEEERGETASSSDTPRVESAADTRKPATEVEPLEVWEVPTEDLSEKPVAIEEPESEAKPAPPLAELEQEDDDPVIEISEDTRARKKYGPIKRLVALNESQIARLKKLKAKRNKRVATYRAKLAAAAHADPRGAPDVRICNTDLQGFGTTDEMKRKLPPGQPKKTERRAADVAKEIVASSCDVVALTGLLGGSNFATAEKSFALFLETLDKRSQKVLKDAAKQKKPMGGSSEAAPTKWRGQLGLTDDTQLSSAFVVRGGNTITLQGVIDHRDKILPRLGRFQQTKFVRTPIEANIVIDKESTTQSRLLDIIVFDLRVSEADDGPQSEDHRLQMAEALRQIAALEPYTTQPDKTPVTILIGERGAGSASGVAEILTGRRRLRDFSEGGVCTLKESTANCTAPSTLPKTLFGVLEDASKMRPRARLSHEKASKEEPPLRKDASRTQEIYLFQSDLPLARSSNGGVGEYAVGVSKGKLVTWVELNW